jgi:saccharopine dehydrogenase (NAD+, L-lysine forming)
MTKPLKIALIREGKVPPDARVLLTPKQCRHIMTQYPNVSIVVQPSNGRCFEDNAYKAEGIEIVEDISDCDLLMGIKEVPIAALIPNKKYFFFSHTAKKQAHNRGLLQAMLAKNTEIIDYELLTDSRTNRLIAFGRFAGMVGAHNGVMGWGLRTGKFMLPRMHHLHDYSAAQAVYRDLKLPFMRAVVTGTGRVANGAAEVLRDMGFRNVSPDDYLTQQFRGRPIFTQLSAAEYVRRRDGKAFDKDEFYAFPSRYESRFAEYYRCTDVLINGIFYDENAPMFFNSSEMRSPSFKIKVIADVTCDIVPHSSIPSTLKASTIESPFFGYDPLRAVETEPFRQYTVDMMTVDNLPNELPRDASEFFGNQFIENILPFLVNDSYSDVIERATICKNGALMPRYDYLKDFVAEKEV